MIAGDGGFQMTQAELSTAAQEGIKVNVAIINNGYLGMVRQWQEFFYERRYAATPMKSPDFVKIAEAHGLTGLRVTQRGRRSKTPSARRKQTEGTVVIDFRVEQEDSVYPDGARRCRPGRHDPPACAGGLTTMIRTLKVSTYCHFDQWRRSCSIR